MKRMINQGSPKAPTPFLKANLRNRENWNNWMKSFKESKEVPVRTEPVFKEINRIATEDAVFTTDVGNVTIDAVRQLNMNGRNQLFTTSGLFATMGYAVPAGIAAKLSFPDRQVFTLSGDGGFAMVMQDIITQVKYNLPIINIVFSNNSLGFIDAEQEDTNRLKFGVDLQGADFAKIAEGMGARGFTITRRDQLRDVFDKARKSNLLVVIDIKTGNRRPFPAEAMILDEDIYTGEKIAAFKKRFGITELPLLKELLK
ncbi:MAG: thiamine pyrophosphate-dependent enzyme [Bacteroides sp.]|nr:thiamine pyrophosphate-dependent enzyme [Bacteroides sp.]